MSIRAGVVGFNLRPVLMFLLFNGLSEVIALVSYGTTGANYIYSATNCSGAAI
jgi:hypothetical protein